MAAHEEPLGISLAMGAVGVAACCAVPTGTDQAGRDARLSLLALGVGVFAAGVVDVLAVAATIGVAFLLFDGFVEGRQGTLGWSGSPDAVRLSVLVAAGALGLGIGAVQTWSRRRRERAVSLPRKEGGTVAVLPRQHRTTPSVHGTSEASAR